MIDKRTIFEIHRLKHLGWSERKIARHLSIDRGSVKKYISTPEAIQRRPNRASKLDPYRDRIKALLDEDPTVSAPVVLQQLAQVRQSISPKTSSCSSCTVASNCLGLRLASF